MFCEVDKMFYLHSKMKPVKMFVAKVILGIINTFSASKIRENNKSLCRVKGDLEMTTPQIHNNDI